MILRSIIYVLYEVPVKLAGTHENNLHMEFYILVREIRSKFICFGEALLHRNLSCLSYNLCDLYLGHNSGNTSSRSTFIARVV